MGSGSIIELQQRNLQHIPSHRCQAAFVAHMLSPTSHRAGHSTDFMAANFYFILPPRPQTWTPFHPVSLQVVVQGLPWKYTWKELKPLFEDCGPIARADVMFGRDGRSRVTTGRVGNLWAPVHVGCKL